MENSLTPKDQVDRQNTMFVRCSTSIIIVLLTAFVASHGQSFYASDFEAPAYSVGDLNGQNGWTADPVYDIANAGLDYVNGSINLPGGSQSLVASEFGDEVLFSTPFSSQSDTFYAAFTFNFLNLSASDFFWIALSDDADVNNSAGFIFSGVTGPDSITGRLRTTGNTSGNPISYTGNNVARVVLEVSKVASTDYNQLRIFLNPSSTIMPILADDTVLGATGISTMNTFLGRMPGGSNQFDPGDELLIDNLLIGSDFASVVIPEPSAFGSLVALSALALLRCRRR